MFYFSNLSFDSSVRRALDLYNLSFTKETLAKERFMGSRGRVCNSLSELLSLSSEPCLTYILLLKGCVMANEFSKINLESNFQITLNRFSNALSKASSNTSLKAPLKS